MKASTRAEGPIEPANARARPGQVIFLKGVWIHAIRWHDLRTLELRLAGREESWLVSVAGKTGKLELVGPSGLSAGKLGEDQTLQSGSLSIVLGRSEVKGSGSAGRSVTLTLALCADAALAGQKLEIELSAVDLTGRRQPFRPAGTLAIAAGRP